MHIIMPQHCRYVKTWKTHWTVLTIFAVVTSLRVIAQALATTVTEPIARTLLATL